MKRRSLERQLAELAELGQANLQMRYTQLWRLAPASKWSEEQLRLAVGYRLQQKLISLLLSKAMEAIQASERIIAVLSTDSSHQGEGP